MQTPYAIKVSVKIGERDAFKEIQVHQVGRAIKDVCQTAKAKSVESLHSLLVKSYVLFDKYFPEEQVKLVAPKHDLLCECRNCQPAFSTFWRELDKSIKWRKDGHLDKRYN